MIKGTTRAMLRRGCAVAAAATALSFSFAPAAHAAQSAWMAEVDDSAELIDGGAPPPGKTSWGSSVQFSGPGKLTVQAYDLGVPMTLMERLDSLSFSVANSTTMLGSHLGDGSMTFNLNGPGQYFVNFSATPSASARFGVPLVSWSISFAPNASAVPLPASLWLLIAGLAWATGMQRRRAKLAPRESGNSVPWIPAGALAH